MAYTVITDKFAGEILDLRQCPSARSALQAAWREGYTKVYVNQAVYNELMNEWHMNPDYGNIDIYDVRGAAQCFIQFSKAAINKGKSMSC